MGDIASKWPQILVAIAGAAILAALPLTLSPYGISSGIVFFANVALVFSIGLILHARSLNAERMDRIEAWRELGPHERPAGMQGRQWAFRLFEEQQLRFANGAAAVAIALSAAALTLGQTGDVRQAHAEAKNSTITVAR